ncbi:carbohydrate ABC transporter permease [Cellulomonas fimi]|uniref:Binding-protein-dependent transport systems inner membrane component n=1 Tax=Cellulomonas fimi (strain ATCC 484 / DSM 20113 / JCM 1341 / CCUG 24087 / LMG 16345 / NBRC 15513 / NCIMB 8980 / NCTC 7547 / NRS-133) TaxID=590998 RepID=F4H178_CELFA|nr:sugar ABC transporter permease [Cellulomonas fimi]AEE47447.1 binding-protein-dependent transport systems inner membrane component [Cellulomonas fimi ATCC 484]NNH05576.1 sugar ABC transporter permease [Cellulomonas fimi]VEH36249.1 sn-glycerol-3-phosphate transport system permease protein ugpA [Cellulomonas fimi]
MSVVSEFRRTAGRRRTPGAARTGTRRGDGKAAAVFLAPWFLGLGLITVGPMLASAYLSFTDYSLLRPPEWIGLDNYTRLFQDTRLLNSLKVTFTYVLTAVPLQLVVALALAMLLDRGLRGLAFYRSVFYLPSLLGGSVAVAILWRQVFGAEGLVNAFLGLFGIEGKGWVSDPDTALWTLVVLHVWTFGAPMIIFLAGLRQIPEMYYEAAAIDGAGKVRQFRSITVPLLTPIIFFNLVLQVIGAFQSFTQAFVVSGGTGGPADSTMFYTLYLYQKGFTAFQMGYASAMAWLLLLIVAAMTAINFLASKYWVFYSD